MVFDGRYSFDDNRQERVTLLCIADKEQGVIR